MQDSLILIVDDLPDWRMVVSAILAELNYSCDTAGSSQEAIQMLSKKGYKLAILDIRLDDSDEYNQGGIDIVNWLVDSNSHTKAIMMTGYGTVEYVHTAFSSGVVVDFCSKASDIDSLIESVKKVMQSM